MPETNTPDAFAAPIPTTQLDRAFGGRMARLLPPWEIIPREFKHGHTPWNKIISRWFFSGLPPETKCVPRPGIDPKIAIDHVGTVLRSFAPKHEHKAAACAWLLSRWFETIELPD